MSFRIISSVSMIALATTLFISSEATAGVVFENGIIQSWTPSSDPDSLGTISFIAGSYSTVSNSVYEFTSGSALTYSTELVNLSEWFDGTPDDTSIAYAFHYGTTADPTISNVYYVMNYTGSTFDWIQFTELTPNTATTISKFSSPARTIYWARQAQANVPEPNTAIAMGLLGVVGLAGNRRRRRQVSAA